jgi:hypothetical protein
LFEGTPRAVPDSDDRADKRDRSDRRDDLHDDRHNDRRDDRRRQDDYNRQDNNRNERTPPSPPKGGNPNGVFQKANREINFIVEGRQAIKTNRQTRSNAREIWHVNTENPRPCGGLNSQSLSSRRIIGFTSLTPKPIRWSSTP